MTAALRRPIEADVLATEAARKQQLAAQAAALLAGHPEAAPKSQLPLFVGSSPSNTRAPVCPKESLKTLGLYRKSVRAQPVMTGYRPQKTFQPITFPWAPTQHLTKLSRSVGREWSQVLESVSTTSLAGGKLYASQGRNLKRIVEELRKHCYLKVDEAGRPAQVREQVVQIVDGERYCFARCECGMSPATFYRALEHPLAHLFIRTQKVQREEEGTQTRRNVATLFTVALYEPEMPVDLEQAFWAESVQELDIFLAVPDSTSQDDGTKRSPLTTQKQGKTCGKLTGHLGGASADHQSAEDARQKLLGWIDSAALISRAGDRIDLDDNTLGSCIDRLRTSNPTIWELAVQIAIHHDEKETQAVAAVGYYKALVHLGIPTVRRCIKRLEKWRAKGQRIDTPGRLLMHHLNREARAATGFPIRDLGTEPGQFVA
ncbi:hypothetical protein [Deinococcus hopiensis]|uniref:Uncharacterized protein n=1 Tax=Deinococcus hopiensis KR-140 TaxID=695939 RepID=A0A1W1U9S5_9DEIO|nr:hypothetical protein [Deinococcus hopiensis]SMB77836.1 hypothetical protein SAMN00790413_03952 [Deinococcus hopiensis KR-140]